MEHDSFLVGERIITDKVQLLQFMLKSTLSNLVEQADFVSIFLCFQRKFHPPFLLLQNSLDFWYTGAFSVDD